MSGKSHHQSQWRCLSCPGSVVSGCHQHRVQAVTSKTSRDIQQAGTPQAQEAISDATPDWRHPPTQLMPLPAAATPSRAPRGLHRGEHLSSGPSSHPEPSSGPLREELYGDGLNRDIWVGVSVLEVSSGSFWGIRQGRQGKGDPPGIGSAIGPAWGEISC